MSIRGQINRGKQPTRVKRVWHYLVLLMLALAMTVPASILLAPTPAEAVSIIITPPLLAPADGTVTNDNTPALFAYGSEVRGGWNDYVDSLGLWYHYQVDDDSHFSSPEFDDISVLGFIEPSLADGKYYWHAYAKGLVHRQFDTVVLSSDWSATYTFTVDSDLEPQTDPAPRPRKAPLRVTCNVGGRSAWRGAFGVNRFSCTPSGGVAPYTFLWNFGDGSTSTAQNPTHNYRLPGNYTVSVTVPDSLGATATCSGQKRVALPYIRFR